MFQAYGIVGQNNLPMREAEKLADKIGVVPRTIYNWNRRIRDGECTCKNFILCTNRQNLSHSKE